MPLQRSSAVAYDPICGFAVWLSYASQNQTVVRYRRGRMTKQNSTKTILAVITIIFAISWFTGPTFATSAQAKTYLKLLGASQSETKTPADPSTILAAARVIFVCSQTGFVKSEVIENELLKRTEFKQTGLVITRDPTHADLIMEIRRSNFTTEYPYVVVNPRTRLVVASGRVNSLFGTAAAKIAKGFIKQVQEARTPRGAKSKN